MPELPEVETVRRGLEHHVAGRAIETVRVLHPRAVRRHLAGPADFEAALAGRSLDGVKRRGKYLWLSVGEDALLAHLGMSGQLLVGEPGRPPPRTCGSGSPSPIPVLICASPTSGRSGTCAWCRAGPNSPP